MHFSCLAFAAAICMAAAAAKAAEPAPQCRAPEAAQSMNDRKGGIAAMEQLPDSCLKEMMMQCEKASGQVLDLGPAAMCSMGYEALMRKSFGGSFPAMMAWWRSERAARDATP